MRQNAIDNNVYSIASNGSEKFYSEQIIVTSVRLTNDFSLACFNLVVKEEKLSSIHYYLV